MGKRIYNATNSAWRRFLAIDRQVARTAAQFADSSFEEPRSLKSAPDYAAIKAFADSDARVSGF